MTIEKVLVLGAGTMGRGIAGWFSQQGVLVELTDADPKILQESQKSVLDSWDKLKAKGKFQEEEINEFKENLKFIKLENISTDSDLLVEAIIEDPKIKKMVFADLDKKLNADAIFASNTSSIPIETLSSSLSEKRKKNFLGLHFFNPATIMKLVEIIEGPETSKELSKELFDWFESKGKKPAICKDGPGFIVNRVARNFYGEALRIVETLDREKIKELDEIMKTVGGFKMGPFELMDLIGIDVNLDVTHSVWEAFSKEPRFAPHKLQQQLVDQGEFGKKTGKGFYLYE